MIIRQFKLLNGDDIIAVMQTKNVDNYIIERPVMVTTHMFGHITFDHWFPLSSQKIFKLYKNRCIQHVPIDEDIQEAYTKFILNSQKKQQFKVQSPDQLLKALVDKNDQYTKMIEDELEISTDDDSDLVSDTEEPTIH
tara:strand:+ start:3775 stop:4188 length:414 start_codon:yes stop_codon:yes gene_type:complete